MDDENLITRRRAVLGGLTTLTVGGIVYGASTLGADSSSTVSAEMYATTGTEAFGIELSGHPIMGALDVPIDIYYWSEYQCPYCAQFESETFPQIIRNFVHPGVVRVIFIEYPYLGKNSITAAVMNYCVWRQVKGSNPDAYWRWHTTVFDHQKTENSGWASKTNLLDITQDVAGVSANKVEQCMSANRQAIERRIYADRQRARSLGIMGTPGFIIYNQQSEKAGKLVGAQPYERFKWSIKQVKHS